MSTVTLDFEKNESLIDAARGRGESTNSLFRSLDLVRTDTSPKERIDLNQSVNNVSRESQKDRNKRGCPEYSKPLIVLLILLFSATAFFILEVQHHIMYDKPFENSEIVLIGSYSIVLLLAIWSLYKMVFSCPGYIPINYKYDTTKMSQRDKMIYEHLRTALHSTMNQQKEMFASGYDRGTIKPTLSESDLRN